MERRAGRADSRAPLAPPRSIGIGAKDPVARSQPTCVIQRCALCDDPSRSARRTAMCPARSGTRISESCLIDAVPQNLSNVSWLVLTTHLLREIERWFPQRNLSDTPPSVRAWRTLHAIQRTRRYGGAWPKDGCGALNWLKSKTRSRKVAASESWIGSPHSLGLTNIRLRRGRLQGVRGPRGPGSEPFRRRSLTCRNPLVTSLGPQQCSMNRSCFSLGLRERPRRAPKAADIQNHAGQKGN